MWDLNRSERRALGSALLLVGVGVVSRAALSPGPGELDWRPQSDPEIELRGVEGAVIGALVRERRAQTPLRQGERIDLNRAPAEELRRLPGIGPGLAEAIIRERRRGPLLRLADVERVPGIGEVTARRLGPFVDFTPRAGLAASPVGSRPAAEPFPTRGGPDRAPAGCPGRPDAVDVNRATQADLERLPGIGPVIAARVIEERTSTGPFNEPAALERVRGIGPRSLSALAGRICAGTP